MPQLDKIKLISSNKVKIAFLYVVTLKSSNTLVKKNIFPMLISSKNKKNSKSMFLRSPKHFKTGKQFITFFNSDFKLNCTIYTGSANLIFLNSNKNTNIFRFLSKFGKNIFLSENHLKKISITTSLIIKI